MRKKMIVVSIIISLMIQMVIPFGSFAEFSDSINEEKIIEDINVEGKTENIIVEDNADEVIEVVSSEDMNTLTNGDDIEGSISEETTSEETTSEETTSEETTSEETTTEEATKTEEIISEETVTKENSEEGSTELIEENLDEKPIDAITDNQEISDEKQSDVIVPIKENENVNGDEEAASNNEIAETITTIEDNATTVELDKTSEISTEEVQASTEENISIQEDVIGVVEPKEIFDAIESQEITFYKVGDTEILSSSEEISREDNKVSNALDNDPNTIWHTKWDEDSNQYYVVFKFDNSKKLNGFEYLPRQNGNNGIVKKYKISVSNDGVNYAIVSQGDWNENKELKKSEFPTVETKYLKFEVLEAIGHWASAAELKPVEYTEVIDQSALNSDIDTDGDGITDILEVNGYVLQNGEVVAWDGTSDNYYTSDPDSWSTTGDHYSDLMKITGRGMDADVSGPAKTNPKIAAYPNVKIRLNSYTVIPKSVISDKKGNSQSDSYSNSVATSDQQKHGTVTGIKHGGKFTIKAGSEFGWDKEFSYEVSVGHTWDNTTSTTSTTTDTTSKIENWETATTTNNAEAANLNFNVSYFNSGTSALLNVLPTFNVKIGNKVVATVTPDESQYMAPILTANDLSNREYGPVMVREISKYKDIMISMDDLKALQLGAPISIETIGIDGELPRYSMNGNSWGGIPFAIYKSQINGKTATILYEWNNGTNENYNVAAKHDHYDPHMKIIDVLKATTDFEIINGDYYINGKQMDSNWGIYSSNLNSFAQRVDKVKSEGKSFLDVELVAGEILTIKEPLAERNPKINWSRFTSDFTDIIAQISEGEEEIKEIIVRVKVGDQIVDMPLQFDEKFWLYRLKNKLSEAADINFESKLIVRFGNNEEIEDIITTPIQKDGLYYVPLRQPITMVGINDTKNHLSGHTDIALNDYPDAEAFVFQVTSNRWSSNQIDVNVGSVNSNFGTTDVRLKTWKLRIKDNNGKYHTIIGSDYLREIKSLSEIGIDDNGIDEVEIVGDPGFAVHMYEDKNFKGESWEIGENETFKASEEISDSEASAKNKISSMRIAYIGENKMERRWYAWLTDFNGKRVMVNGDTWKYFDISSEGIRNDNLQRIEFIAHPSFNLYAMKHGLRNELRSREMLDTIEEPISFFMGGVTDNEYWKLKSGSVNHGHGITSLFIRDYTYDSRASMTENHGSWNLKITDTNNKVFNISGTDDLYELSDISTKGISDNAVKSVELSGSAGYTVHMYEDSDFYGNAWRLNTGGKFDVLNGKNENNISARNKISSLRVAYIGNNKSDKRWYAWLSDFDGKRVKTNGYDWKYSNISSLGISNDNLKRIEFIGHPDFDMYALRDGMPGSFEFYESLSWTISLNGIVNKAWKMSTGSVEHGHGITGIAVMDKEIQNTFGTREREFVVDEFKRGAQSSPIISKTIVVSREKSSIPVNWNINDGVRMLENEVTDAWIDVQLVGYYTRKDSEGLMFKPYSIKDKLYGLKNISRTIATGVNAKGYLINVTNMGISSDDVEININGVSTHLGSPDPVLYEETRLKNNLICNGEVKNTKSIIKMKSGMKSNIMFVPTDTVSGVLKVNTTFSDWKITDRDDPYIEIEILGYFGDDGDLVYVNLDDTIESNQLPVNIDDYIDSNHHAKIMLYNSKERYYYPIGKIIGFDGPFMSNKLVIPTMFSGSMVSFKQGITQGTGMNYLELDNGEPTPLNRNIYGTGSDHIQLLGYFH